MKNKKLKKILISSFIILLIVLAYPTFLMSKLISKNYSFSTSIYIIKNDLTKKVINEKYSKTLETVINNNKFNIKFINNYFEIEYKDSKTFTSSINTLLNKGYSSNDINKINNTLSETETVVLLKKEYIKDLTNYLEFNFFKIENLDRYLKYASKDYKEKIVHVNIGLDKKHYEDAKIINDFNEMVLTNKYNKLNESFEPNNIQKVKSNCSIGVEYLSITAKNAFEKMCDDAAKEKKYILANSAYRSYSDQQKVYNTYLKLYGQTYVNNYVATPGFSEHQTGLAVDVAAKGYNIFKTSPEYNWMLNNAYKYGFILRYPSGKEKITGFNAESWHFRYVGTEAAKYIQENKITYDEYFVMFVDIK